MQLSSHARKAVAAALTASTVLWAGIGIVPQIASAAVHSEGCLVLSGGIVWMITNGTRRGYTSAEVFQSYGYNFSQVTTASAEDVALPVGPIMIYADGTLVKGPSDPLVYLVAGGQKRPFVSGSVFTGLGYSFANIQQAPYNTFADLPTGSNLDSTTIAHPAGTNVISNGAIWQMDMNGRRGFSSGANFLGYGYMFSHVVSANSYDLASQNLGDVPNRPACTGGGGTPPPPPVSGSMSVSLASDNPAGGTHASGTAYNPALKINLTAGSAGATVSSITVTRSGISIDSNISGVAAFDLSGMRLTNSFVTFADSKALLTFATPLVIPANGSTSVTIKTNISGTSGTYNLSIASASAVVSTAAVTGSFPVVGNTFSMANGGSVVGAVTLDAILIHNNGANDVTAVNINLGTVNQQLAKFRFVASSNEDVEVRSIMMYNNGNTNDADIQNIKLLAPDGSTLASATQTTGRYVNFVLSTPYKITKGNTRDLSVNVDVVSGSTRNFRLVIQNDYDVEVRGLSTGSGILVTAATTVDGAFPIGDSSGGGANCAAGITCINKITVNSGSALFNKASDSPSGNVAAGANSATLGKWEFTPQGENMEVRQVTYTLTWSGTALTGTFRIQLNGSTIYSVAGGSTAATGVNSGNLTASSYINIPAGTKAIFTVVGDINSSATSGTTYLVALDVTQVKRMSTGDLVDPSVTITSANTLTVSTAALGAAKNSSFGDTTVVAGLSGAKAGSFNLTASSTEDVTVSSMTVGLTNTTNVSNLILKDGSTQLGSATTTPASTNVVGMSLTVPKGTTKTIDVYLTTNSATTGTEVTSLTAVSATGTSSGTTVTTTGLTATGQTITFSTGGTLSISLDTTNTPVLGIAHSGEVDRTLLATRLTSNNAEALNITTVQVSATNGATSLRDLKLYVNGSQVGSTTQLNSSVALFSNPTGLFTIAQDTTATLTVKGSTTSTGTIGSQGVGNLSIDYVEALGASGGTRIKPGTTLVTSWTAGNSLVTNVVSGTAMTVADTTGFHAGDAVFAYDATNGGFLGIVAAEPTSTTGMYVATTTAITWAGSATISKIGSGASTAFSAGGGAVGAANTYTVTTTKGFSVGDPVIAVGLTATRLGYVSAIASATSMSIVANGATTGSASATLPGYIAKLGTDTGITTTTTASLTATATATTVVSTTGFNVGDMLVAIETGSDGAGTGAVAGTYCIVTAVGSSTSMSLQCKAAVTVATAKLVRVGQANPSTTLVTTAASAGTRAVATAAATVTDQTGFGIGDVVISQGSAATGADVGKVTAVSALSVSATASAAAGTFARLTRLPAAASAGATITFHDVEPTITDALVTGGNSTGQSGQVVGVYNIKADGDRNMNITGVNVQANGNNLPWQYVTNYDLYNGSTLLASATPLNDSSPTADAEAANVLTGSTLYLCWDATDNTGTTGAGIIYMGVGSGSSNATVTQYKLSVNDTIVLFVSTSNYLTAKVTAIADAAASCGDGTTAGNNADLALTVTNSSTTGTAPTGTSIVSLKNFNVHFDSNSATPLATQTVTAGSTLGLTVKADTTAVRSGLSAGTTASYNTKINGTQGASNGGLTWGYTPSGGSAITSITKSDSYPVNGPTFSY